MSGAEGVVMGTAVCVFVRVAMCVAVFGLGAPKSVFNSKGSQREVCCIKLHGIAASGKN